MPVIKLNDRQFTLTQGQTRLGGGAGVEVPVADDAGLGVQAIVEVGKDNKAVIRRATPNANVRVNGVNLGVEPTPLIHGDKVEVAGKELFFADDAKSGATQFVSASDIAAIAAVKRTGPARATSATGGRLVSLVDGKEYTIPAGGASIGREASCEIVVAQSEVSRKHAMISPAEEGYIIKDLSANGVLVNGVRINQQQLLARADVIRVGTEEFRFYADVKPAAKPSPAAAAAPAAAAPAASPAAPAPSPARPAPVEAPPKAPPAPTPAAAAPPVPAAAPKPAPAPAAPKAVPHATPHAPTPHAPTPHASAHAAPAAKPKHVPAPAPAAEKLPAPAEKKGAPASLWIVLAVIVLAAAAYFLFGRG